MTLSLRVIGPNYVHQAWPKVKEFVESAIAKGHDFPEWSLDYKAEHVLQFIAAGQWLLVVAVDEELNVQGSCTVSFLNYPLHRVAFVTTIGGKLISNEDTFKQFTDILKSHGATKIQGYGRDSIVRLWKRYNFEPRNTLVEVLL